MAAIYGDAYSIEVGITQFPTFERRATVFEQLQVDQFLLQIVGWCKWVKRCFAASTHDACRRGASARRSTG